MYVQTMSVYTVSVSPELNSVLQSYLNGMTLTDGIKTRDPVGQAKKKVILRYHMQW